MKISITFEENRQEIPTDFEENSTGFNTEFGNFISVGGDCKSAYEIAVKNGFEGTEEEWLESLQGEDGKDGIDGISPIASIEDITGGHRVTITDKEGAKTFDVMDGKDGQGGGGGVTSWNDLTDKPFREMPKFNIQWDGDMTGHTVLDMSMLGYPQGMYFVKVSNDVFTTEELIGCRYARVNYDGNVFGSEIYSDMIDTATYPGAIFLNGYVVIVHDDNTLATALGIPTGIYTNGIYFYLRTESGYVSSLVSANTITKVDNEHLDMDSIITDVLNALPIYNGEVVAE